MLTDTLPDNDKQDDEPTPEIIEEILVQIENTFSPQPAEVRYTFSPLVCLAATMMQVLT
jgi:hypothetical protein